MSGRASCSCGADSRQPGDDFWCWPAGGSSDLIQIYKSRCHRGFGLSSSNIMSLLREPNIFGLEAYLAEIKGGWREKKRSCFAECEVVHEKCVAFTEHKHVENVIHLVHLLSTLFSMGGMGTTEEEQLSPGLWIHRLTLWRCSPWYTWPPPSSQLRSHRWQTYTDMSCCILSHIQLIKFKWITRTWHLPPFILTFLHFWSWHVEGIICSYGQSSVSCCQSGKEILKVDGT